LSRVAIVGSCITRDLWPILGEAPGDLLYISRTSLPSLFSTPIRGLDLQDDLPNGLKRHQHNAVVADLRKTALAALVAYRPSHIIFDFIDERFDLLAAPGGLVTQSWELETSGYLAQPPFAGVRAVARTSAACERLWTQALDELCDFLQATPLREARLILHQSQWAQRYRDDAGQMQDFDPVLPIFDGRPARVADHNALLDRYQDRFAAATGAERVNAGPNLQVGDAGHRWGLSPFHYVTGYYAEIRRQLDRLGV
jgi:hypothetical protein